MLRYALHCTQCRFSGVVLELPEALSHVYFYTTTCPDQRKRYSNDSLFYLIMNKDIRQGFSSPSPSLQRKCSKILFPVCFLELVRDIGLSSVLYVGVLFVQ